MLARACVLRRFVGSVLHFESVLHFGSVLHGLRNVVRRSGWLSGLRYRPGRRPLAYAPPYSPGSFGCNRVGRRGDIVLVFHVNSKSR